MALKVLLVLPQQAKSGIHGEPNSSTPNRKQQAAALTFFKALTGNPKLNLNWAFRKTQFKEK